MVSARDDFNQKKYDFPILEKNLTFYFQWNSDFTILGEKYDFSFFFFAEKYDCWV